MGLHPRSLSCTGHGSKQLNVQMVYVWVGLLGEAPMLGWAKLQSFKSHSDLEWSIRGSSIKVPNLCCVYPNTARGSRSQPSAITVMFRGWWMSMGVGRTDGKKFLKSPFWQLTNFAKINTLYRSLWTGKYHYLHSKINSTMVCINMYSIYLKSVTNTVS